MNLIQPLILLANMHVSLQHPILISIVKAKQEYLKFFLAEPMNIYIVILAITVLKKDIKLNILHQTFFHVILN